PRRAVTAESPMRLGCERAVRLRPEHGPADGENVRTVGRAIARRAVVARGKAADDMSAVTRGSDRSVQGSPAPSRGPTGRDDVSILESLPAAGGAEQICDGLGTDHHDPRLRRDRMCPLDVLVLAGNHVL